MREGTGGKVPTRLETEEAEKVDRKPRNRYNRFTLWGDFHAIRIHVAAA